VRRTLPFELHARIQSEARVALKRALLAAREATRAATRAARSGAEEETAAAAPAAAPAEEEEREEEEGERVRRLVANVGDGVCARARALLDACVALADASSSSRDADETLLDETAFIEALDDTSRAALTLSDADAAANAVAFPSARVADACVTAADALAALLFASPPNPKANNPNANANERLGVGRDTLWEVTSRAVLQAWRRAAAAAAAAAGAGAGDGDGDGDAIALLSTACARAFLAPDRWLASMTDVAPAPFTQRRAEACAARVVRSFPSAAAAVERNENENGRDVTVSVVSACASVAAAAPAALALVRAAIDSELVGVVGVAVVLRAFANALDAAGGGGDGDGDAGKLRAVVSADDAAALGKLARGLASMCDEAGEKRTRRRVEASPWMDVGGV